jgi:hypothetical protein
LPKVTAIFSFSKIGFVSHFLLILIEIFFSAQKISISAEGGRKKQNAEFRIPNSEFRRKQGNKSKP